MHSTKGVVPVFLPNMRSMHARFDIYASVVARVAATLVPVPLCKPRRPKPLQTDPVSRTGFCRKPVRDRYRPPAAPLGLALPSTVAHSYFGGGPSTATFIGLRTALRFQEAYNNVVCTSMEDPGDCGIVLGILFCGH